MSKHHTHRILVIDDQAAIHEDYRKILGQQTAVSSAAVSQAAAKLFGDDPDTTVDWEGFELDSAFQGQEGLELVRRSISERRPYAVAFVDIRMPPGWDGVETVRHIWEVDPEILIVICSAYSDYSWDEMVRELGRNDRYLILKKPFDNIEVRQCAMALTERWSVSRTDVLTELLNRRAFRSYVELEWGRSQRHGFPLSCAMLDLDYFKRVNDTLGHRAGDRVLTSVARTLQMKCRASDSVCRYGGEEFCILLPHINEQDAAIWAENARRAIESTPIMIDDRPVSVTASIGVAERLATNDDVERLIDRADQALIRAKAAGRNRVTSYITMKNVGASGDELAARVSPWQKVSLRQVMTAPVVSIQASATVGEATQCLLQFHVSSAPVVDREGRLVGILSDNDVIGILDSPEAWRMPIDRIIRREVVRYEEDAPLESICAFLNTSAVRRVVIVRDGRPIGFVSRRGLLKWYAGQMGVQPDERVGAALHFSRDIDRARLAQDAQTVARCAAQLSQSVTESVDDAAWSLVAGICELQGLVDGMLNVHSDDKALPPVGKFDDADAAGPSSGPSTSLE